MKVLIIKLTSLGDVIHALPAITDAKKAIPELEIDFLVDESFAEIPAWHNGITAVKTVANRRWKRSIFKSLNEIKGCYSSLKAKQYDKVVDLQGLVKSALWAKVARGERHGYARCSIKEPLAAKFYSKTHKVEKYQHAINRNRILLAKSLGYEFDETGLDYGFSKHLITSEDIQSNVPKTPFWVFLHGTAWASKQWPKSSWRELAKLANQNEKPVILPWGNPVEKARAEEIANGVQGVIVLPKSSLSDLMHYFELSEGIVSVDTGLGHLAAALNKPTVAIYGPTDTKLVGISGDFVAHISTVQSNSSMEQKKSGVATIKTDELFDYSSVTPKAVFELLKQKIANDS